MAKSGKRGISRRLPNVVRHILEGIAQVNSFVEGMDGSAFDKDVKTLYAVVRCLEIISEASRDIPDTIKQEHPEIPWRRIADAGNVYRHIYDAVRPDIVWRVVKDDLPVLKIAIDSIRKKHVELGP